MNTLHVGLALAGGLVLGVGGLLVTLRYADPRDSIVNLLQYPPDLFADERDDDGDLPDVVDLSPPDVRPATLGTIEELYQLRKERKKRRKLASKGYVQWFLIEDSYPKPKFVKPKAKGGGIPELKHNGERYLFPRDAMVASEQQGLWTVVHKAGEADPVNLRDPTRNSIPTDTLEEYLTLRVSSSPPGFFDNLDIDPDDILKYAFAAIILVAVGQGVLGGGF